MGQFPNALNCVPPVVQAAATPRKRRRGRALGGRRSLQNHPLKNRKSRKRELARGQNNFDPWPQPPGVVDDRKSRTRACVPFRLTAAAPPTLISRNMSRWFGAVGCSGSRNVVAGGWPPVPTTVPIFVAFPTVPGGSDRSTSEQPGRLWPLAGRRPIETGALGAHRSSVIVKSLAHASAGRQRRFQVYFAGRLAVVPDAVVADTVVPDAVVADTVIADAVVADAVVADAVVPDTVVADAVVTHTLIQRQGPLQISSRGAGHVSSAADLPQIDVGPVVEPREGPVCDVGDANEQSGPRLKLMSCGPTRPAGVDPSAFQSIAPVRLVPWMLNMLTFAATSWGVRRVPSQCLVTASLKPGFSIVGEYHLGR